MGGPVVLVGHSYGGAVITVAGMAENVVGLVYVAAHCLPARGLVATGDNSINPQAPVIGEAAEHQRVHPICEVELDA
ncbi:alpha/beta hydrolase [Actinopolymorpha sp. NPDC004070]|uniref:alpha/beta hydrolase n=1 Tax=Actinopolymorpha sp. NPDC004070 TaxID=3154548 RepID=UPI0033B3F7C0